MDFLKITLTALLSAGTLFVIAKCMGHKQVAQLDFFDYISGITIGSIAAELATDLEAPWKSLTALVIYGIVSVVLGLLTSKFPRSRKFINGTPTILMNNGRIIRENLKKAKLDLSEFLLLCREQGYFDLDEIQTAVFEHNGKLSVLPKAEKCPATPYVLNLTVRRTSERKSSWTDVSWVRICRVRVGMKNGWRSRSGHRDTEIPAKFFSESTARKRIPLYFIPPTDLLRNRCIY